MGIRTVEFTIPPADTADGALAFRELPSSTVPYRILGFAASAPAIVGGTVNGHMLGIAWMWNGEPDAVAYRAEVRHDVPLELTGGSVATETRASESFIERGDFRALGSDQTPLAVYYRVSSDGTQESDVTVRLVVDYGAR